MLYSEMALYFMVNLIYSCIAPVMSYFMLMTFTILSLVYRHQLIYIYTSKSDRGGKLWPCMINLLLVSILISEVTLIGIMSIKEGAVAAALLIPLVIVTVLFVFYIKQEHFRVTEFVPSTICKEEDIKNHGSLDMSLLSDKYLQPSLQVKYEYPETDLTGFEMSNARLPDNFEIADKVPDTSEAGDMVIHEPEEDYNDIRQSTVRHVSRNDSFKITEFRDISSEVPYEERIKLVENFEQLHEHERGSYEKLESDAFYSCKEQEINELNPSDDMGLHTSSSHSKSHDSLHCNENSSCLSELEKEVS